MKQTPILFVDISELVQRDSKTGIQRVVRCIVNDLLVHGAKDRRVEFVYASKGGRYRFARGFIGALNDAGNATPPDNTVDPQPGDIFLVLDFQDTMSTFQAAFLRGISENGTGIYFVVYDLLPIHFRKYFPPSCFVNHSAWLNTVTQSDGAICISRAVAIELEEWLKLNKPIRKQTFDIGWFHLGANFNASLSSRGLREDADDVLHSFERRPTFLLVGTIEPRKGYAQTLAAFQKLWQEGLDVNLVIVGKPGWMVQDLIDDLHKCAEKGSRLFWLNGISDEYLAAVYAASTCLIAASEGEGFGLPLVEAAIHKLPIIARDIPVFREVAGAYAFYFSGLAPSALADTILKWLALYKSGQFPSSNKMPVLTWSQSTRQLLDVVLKNNWSAHWTSDGRFCCSGSDPKLSSLVGKKQGPNIETTGVEGVLLYGPYISLPAGEYRIGIYGSVKNSLAPNFEITLTAHLGKTIFASKSVASYEAGLIKQLVVNIPMAVAAFEVHLWVSAECDMSVGKLEIILNTPSDVAANDPHSVEESKPLVGDREVNRPNPNGSQPEKLQEVLMEADEEFIEAAYLALLKRRPDASGGMTYLRALRNGTSKLQILHELAQSDDCLKAGGVILGLAEACAKEGIGKPSDEPLIAAPAEATQVTRAEQLLVLDDHNKLIEIAYWVLLKRAPDLDGIENYMGKLKSGMGKTQFLHELFTSEECRETGVELPGLRDAFAREELDVDVLAEKPLTPSDSSMHAAKTLSELLGYQGGQFVECAYVTLLQRAADSQEFQERSAQILGGTSKIQILSEMSASKEAVMKGSTLPGLTATLFRYNLSRMPILGSFIKLFVDIEGDSIAERRGRITEQRLLTIGAELGEQFERINRTSSDISAAEQKVLADRQKVDARISSLEKSVVALRQLIERYQVADSETEPRTLHAGVMKAAGRLALDLRAEEIARDLKRVR